MENEKLPKSQRRPEPQPPEVVRGGDGKIDYEATNQAAYQASLTQLVKCANCGRKFASERLAIHQKSCTAENPAKPVGALKVHRDVHLATTQAKEEHLREQKATKKGGGGMNGVSNGAQKPGWKDT